MKINYGRRVHEIVDAALEVIGGVDAERKSLDQKMKDGIITQNRGPVAATERPRHD